MYSSVERRLLTLVERDVLARAPGRRSTAVSGRGSSVERGEQPAPPAGPRSPAPSARAAFPRGHGRGSVPSTLLSRRPVTSKRAAVATSKHTSPSRKEPAHE